MTDTIAYEDLMKFVDQIKMMPSQPTHTFHGPKAWAWELKHHPDRFYRNESDELMWLGTKVVVVGDGNHFWSMADKIIPKENQL